jgi:hypothetical protein
MENNELKDKLERHDLELLSFRKPELVERTVNKASDNVNRCFEIMTGSPLTVSEKNAANGREFNSECPWLYEENIK